MSGMRAASLAAFPHHILHILLHTQTTIFFPSRKTTPRFDELGGISTHFNMRASFPSGRALFVKQLLKRCIIANAQSIRVNEKVEIN